MPFYYSGSGANRGRFRILPPGNRRQYLPADVARLPNIFYNRRQETTHRGMTRTTTVDGMALYFKNKKPKTFLGAPVGWPLMCLMALDLFIAGLMFLSEHNWSGLILLYPPVALALAMIADSRKEKLAAQQRRRR
ncbi:hypothetical protein [Herbaspirillum sp.]|uniref:hypothetical protein n=1 Tax=Herbaspirillum sp. TaxID=1890675 RepID=UPI0031D72723